MYIFIFYSWFITCNLSVYGTCAFRFMHFQFVLIKIDSNFNTFNEIRCIISLYKLILLVNCDYLYNLFWKTPLCENQNKLKIRINVKTSQKIYVKNISCQDWPVFPFSKSLCSFKKKKLKLITVLKNLISRKKKCVELNSVQ